MDVFKFIKEIEFPDMAKISLLILTTIAPGFLIIYMYLPGLFESLETVKLIIFATALALPIPVINTILIVSTCKYVTEQELKQEFTPKNAKFLTHVSLFISFILMYLAIFVVKFLIPDAKLTPGLSFRLLAGLLAAFELVVVLSVSVGASSTIVLNIFFPSTKKDKEPQAS